MADYANIYASLVKFLTLIPSAPQYVDLDEHVGLDNIPDGDFLSTRGLSVAADVTMEVDVLIGVSTVDDIGMFRHRGWIDQLFSRLQPGQSLPFLDATSGAELGYLKVLDGTHVTPVARTQTRALQEIQVTFVTDRQPTRS